MKKRLISMILVLAAMLALAVPALAAAPIVKETEYEGSGYVDVDFTGRVSYKNVKVTVKNAAGKSLSAQITDKDRDELTFHVSGLKADTTYTYKISGVRSGASGKYGTVSGTFRTPPDRLHFKELDYDRRDKEVEIDFSQPVQYKNVKVTVKDAAGKSYTAKITEKSSRELEVYVKGLKAGKTYTVTVSGVRGKGTTDKYGTVSGSFTA